MKIMQPMDGGGLQCVNDFQSRLSGKVYNSFFQYSTDVTKQLFPVFFL